MQPASFWQGLWADDGPRHAVSREHFELLFVDGVLTLQNFSGSGTCVNGKAITREVRVEGGDRISIRASSAPDAVTILSFSLEEAGCVQASLDSAGSPEWRGNHYVELRGSRFVEDERVAICEELRGAPSVPPVLGESFWV